jgi:hypothetical protein
MKGDEFVQAAPCFTATVNHGGNHLTRQVCHAITSYFMDCGSRNGDGVDWMRLDKVIRRADAAADKSTGDDSHRILSHGIGEKHDHRCTLDPRE